MINKCNKKFLDMTLCARYYNMADTQENNYIGASPSGKAAGFGPAIPEVRILPPQPLKSSQ